MGDDVLKYVVGMVGARRDYDVAKILFENDMLQQLFVDTAYQDTAASQIPVVGTYLKQKLKKYVTGIKPELVSADWIGAIEMRMLLKYASKNQAYTLANNRLAKRSIKYSRSISSGGYYGFDTSSLEFMEWAQGRNWHLVMEQCVAPRAAQIEMYQLFEKKYGLNYQSNIDHCLFQQEREQKEWQLTHKIIAPSLYVKEELVKTKLITENKIEILPFGYTNNIEDAEIAEIIEKKQNLEKPIQILFAGNAGYRKGIIDLLEIADKFAAENIIFKIAGHLEQEAIEHLKNNKNSNLHYLGKLNRKELIEEYKKADVFFFPSYLEGSAMVLLEAMSWGLPIVTTYQSGSVVEHGKNGLICNAGDVNSLTANLEKIITDNQLRYTMGMNSLSISSKYSINQYGRKLIELLNS